VLVVDDGSPHPAAIAAVAAAHGAEIIHHPVARGPAAARNTGLTTTRAPLVAFIDSDIVVAAGCLARLTGHFADPGTGAVAPRVMSQSSGGGTLAAYEARHSSLDMGRRPGLVRPWSPVPYLPSATLVVRRQAISAGFEEDLRTGEDVDFVWRLADAGWAIRYDPAVTVQHELPASARELARKRFSYAASIGVLAVRHPTALPAIRIDAAAAVVVLTLLRRPWLAIALAGREAMRIHGTLRHRTAHPAGLAATIGGRSLLGAVRSLAHAVRRPWWPIFAVAAISSQRFRVLLAGAWVIGCVEARTAHPSHAALAVADDLISGAGTWWSCLRCRTTIPLRPSRR
jgi:mycofactocin system glycosyltransferase